MSITALGTDMPNTEEAFLVHMQNLFYLVSCPEGTQRYCSERGYHFARPGRLKLVILPETCPSSIMGFPGVYMAMADCAEDNNSTVNVLTKNEQACALLENWWQKCGIAFRSRKISVKFHHTEWIDECCHFRFHSRGFLKITFSGKNGTFLPEAAIRLGINKQNFDKLHRGHCVRSDQKPWKVVYPHQVVSPPQAPRRLLYSPYFKIDESDVVQFNPHLIITTEENVSCIKGNAVMTGESNADVWLINPEKRTSCFLGASCLHELLHCLDSCSFPSHAQSSASFDLRMCESSEINFYRITPGLIYDIYYTKKGKIGTCFEKCKLDAKIRHQINENKKLRVYRTISSNSRIECPLLYVFGSGCATPSVFRNVSCYMVATARSGHPSVLHVIDCGEGSLGQLSRVEDPAKFLLHFDAVVLAITHGHADHHFGSWSFLRYLYCIRPELWHQKAVKIYIPELLKSYAHSMLKMILPWSLVLLMDEIINCLPVSGGPLGNGINCVPVLHSAEPYGYILTLGKMKIVFSGDTRPSEELVVAGQNARFLIHEATFLDIDSDDAKLKMHSTVSEALGVQKAMRAERCLLSHFSQKYIKRTGELIAAAQRSQGAACAIDFLCVNLNIGFPAILFSTEIAEAIAMVQRIIKLAKRTK